MIWVFEQGLKKVNAGHYIYGIYLYVIYVLKFKDNKVQSTQVPVEGF
jgi:hypothetical protein